MKKIVTLIVILSIFILQNVIAQAPEKMSYQSVVRNSNNELVTNTQIGMQISILQYTNTGAAVYTETHTPQTNDNGLVTLEIGTGATNGDFSVIDWTSGPYFIKTETDINGGSNYTISGTSQMLSVPYALFAKNAETANNVSINGDEIAFDGWDKNETDDFDGAYTSLSGVPVNVSEFTNDAGYLDSYTETDPIYSTSVAADITADDTVRWGQLNPIGDSLNILTYDGNNWIAKDLVITTNNTGSGNSIDNMQPYNVVRYCIATIGTFPSRSGNDTFLGEIQLYGFNFNPRGFLNCDGQLLAISQNTALFSLLGTMYGGDGRTTFGLPDLRGRVPIHVGSGPGLTPRYHGQKSGLERVILSVPNLPAHNHTVTIIFED